MPKARTRRTSPALTIGQRDSVRAAVTALQSHPDVSTAQPVIDALQREFPTAFATAAGPLFDVTDAPAITFTEHWDEHPVDFLDFPGRTALTDAYHPRIMAWVKVRRAPSQPPVIGQDDKWQLDCLYERWRYRVGEIPYGRWVRDMKGALQLYSFVGLWNAIEAFRESRQPTYTANRFGMFLDNLREFVTTGAMPYRNAAGDLTTRGARAQALREARHAHTTPARGAE